MTRKSLLKLILTLLGIALSIIAFIPVWRGIGVLAPLACGLVVLLIMRYCDFIKSFYKIETRRKKMQEAAEQMEFSFRYTSASNVLGPPQSFWFSRNILPFFGSLDNVIGGAVADAQLTVFDISPNTQNSLHKDQTVLAIKAPRLNFPHFAVLPATLWSVVGRCFRRKAVSAPSLPAGYQLITSDNSVDARISRLTDWLDGQTSIEAGEEFLLVYRRDKLVQPENVKNLVTLGLHIYDALAVPAAIKDLSN